MKTMKTMTTWPRPNATGGRIWTTWPAWSACCRRNARWPGRWSGCGWAGCWRRSRVRCARPAASATSRTRTCRRGQSSVSRTALKLSPELLGAYQALAEAYRRVGRAGEGGRDVAAIGRAIPREPRHAAVSGRSPYPARRALCGPRLRLPRPAAQTAGCEDQGDGMGRSSGVGAASRAGGAVGRGASGVRGRGETGRSARGGYHLLVRRAALELKAGDLGLANRLLDRAQERTGRSGAGVAADDDRKPPLRPVAGGGGRVRAPVVDGAEEEPPQRAPSAKCAG